jgi:hypothetical protein
MVHLILVIGLVLLGLFLLLFLIALYFSGETATDEAPVWRKVPDAFAEDDAAYSYALSRRRDVAEIRREVRADFERIRGELDLDLDRLDRL